MNLMSDTKDTFHEVQPLGKIPMKQAIPYEFHRNCRNPILCSKGVLVGNFPIGLQYFIEFLHFSFVPKGALNSSIHGITWKTFTIIFNF